MNTIYTIAIAALALAVGTSAYIVVAWRKAPKAFRSMKWLAAMSLSAGLLGGIFCDHALTQFAEKSASAPISLWRRNPCAPDGAPAADLGKTLVLTDQEHSADDGWMDLMGFSEICAIDSPTMNRECQAYYIARHALGFDLSKGDTRACIPYEEVAEMSGLGNPPKNSSFCKEAYHFQRRRLHS